MNILRRAKGKEKTKSVKQKGQHVFLVIVISNPTKINI